MEPNALGYLAAGIGAGITVIGAGLGIGKLAADVNPRLQDKFVPRC
jgi:F0F1-type ATP synthase membrane subunit c/vacuolar-type H+-ATPase subunit K